MMVLGGMWISWWRTWVCPGVGENTSDNWPTRCCSSAFWATVVRAASWSLVPTHFFSRLIWYSWSSLRRPGWFRQDRSSPWWYTDSASWPGICRLSWGQGPSLCLQAVTLEVGWFGCNAAAAPAEPWWGATGLMAWPGRFVLSSLSHVRSRSGWARAVVPTLLSLHLVPPGAGGQTVARKRWSRSKPEVPHIPNSTYGSMRSQSRLSSAATHRSICLRVWLNGSTRPSVWVWYTEFLSCFILSRVHRSAISRDIKEVPWSVSILAGIPTRLQSRKSSGAMDLAVAFWRGTASGYRVA